MLGKMLLSKIAFDRTRVIWTLGLATLVLAIIPPTASAQYFGRNKVQFDDFDFEILLTDHFDIHYYPEETEAVLDAARNGPSVGTRGLPEPSSTNLSVRNQSSYTQTILTSSRQIHFRGS